MRCAAPDNEAQVHHVKVLPGTAGPHVATFSVQNTKLTQGIDGQTFEVVAHFGSLKLNDHGCQGGVLLVDPCAQQAEIIEAQGHEPTLDFHQPVTENRVVDNCPPIHRLGLH